MSESIIEPEIVALDVDLGSTKTEVITALAGIIAAAGRAEAEGLTRDALAREEKFPTGMPGRFAIPHCRSEAVSRSSLGFARLANPVDFGGKDGPADIVFLIAAGADGGEEHMKLLTKLARAMVKKDFVQSLREAPDADAIVTLVRGIVEPQPAAAEPAPQAAAAATEAADEAPAASGEAPKARIVAVTACPTGIAHTYMAADYLTESAKKAGVELQAEPQGSSGYEPLPPEVIKSADAVIFATDVGVKGRNRFAGLPVIESGVKRAVNEPDVMVAEAIAAIGDPNAHKVHAVAEGASADAEEEASQLGWGKRIQQSLMTGVSYMIPFVAAGGLLIALGFLFGGYEIADNGLDIALENSLANLPEATGHALAGSALMTYIGAVLFAVGQAAFGFLLPALAGYIGFGLAERPGIVPGFVAGAIASLTGAGFIGAIVGGLVGGFVAYWFTTLNAPRWLRGLMPVAVIPLVGSLISGGLMYVVLGRPLAWLTTTMNNALSGMSGTSAIILGIILGLMMCFDLGGPINKAAYLFATTNLDINNVGSMRVMAATMAAGMVPPLALALSTALRPKYYTPAERENGTAAWLLGASFISEGAIPFAAADPLRVIPSMMAGGAVTGALSMALGAASMAPHGGIFVFFAIERFWAFVLSIVVGAIVAGLLVTVLKGAAWRKKNAESQQEAAPEAEAVAA
ncbi:protein-Npi-phosphohistidine-sugar phosphotransferase [Propionibacterium ruminifibrarum]|uniref:Protein-Npi-phosphohistidine-sugar phosphotransferase n=1 Tax=Propionibacterium ruminifibrarum TaxID=1962131 RepID=A0A375I3F3_9ACTN|nr:fructose-specific PTS transporter subunit EIIC [Propionibacterium ruminifibrarum]SPF68244.1 protein-Npi-phosphohistidine-sugar phosphotransferase [Propionibacterium ruminifibrarum]